MAQPLPTRKHGNSLAVWAIGIIVVGFIFCGIRVFLNSQGQLTKHPPVGAITHSTPVGGEVLDGVFRSSPSNGDPGLTRWKI
jgi:hypothetical protein